MKRVLNILLMILCLGVSNEIKAQSCSDVPVINSFEPNTGFIGSVVEIFGANFDPSNVDNNVVYFGATKAVVLSATFGKLEVVVPVGASTDRISVTNDCNLTAYSAVPFNGIFCPTPIDGNTYQNNAQILGVTYGAYNMIAFDMDLDGRPEVLSANNGGGLSVAQNNSTPGNISFSHINMGGRGGQSIYGADFDGDGYKDIVTTYNVWRNTSGQTNSVSFSGSAVSSQSVSDYQVAAGDFNKDGKIDIVGENGNWLYIARNTSSGPGTISFAGRQGIADTGNNVNGLMVGDVDGDGKVDILCNQRGTSNALFYRNTTTNGSATFSFAAPVVMNTGGTGPYRSQIADFNKDGKIDYVTVNYDNPNFNTAVFINTSTPGNISFNSPINLPSPSCNYRVQVGDVDGDGYPDIVSKSLCNNIFSVYRNTTTNSGSTSFAPRFDYTSSARGEVSGIVIGDLDGDFVPDIATSGIDSRQIRFHRNTSAQEDNTNPTAIAQDVVVGLSPDGTVTVTAEQVDNGSSDACGIGSIVLSQTEFTCDDIGPNNVTLTVTDAAGNVSIADAIVNVQPAAIIVSGQTTVCQGESVPLTANDGDSYQWYRDGTLIAGATSQTYTATVSGAYTVDVTNAGGCSGTSLPTDVVVNDNPTVEIEGGNTVFLCNGSATITASQSSIYQWMKDGVDIPNATLQTYTTTQTGTYSVRVIDLFGCSAVSDPITVSSDPAPYDDVTISGDITVSSSDDFCGATVSFPTPTASNGCGDPDITLTQIAGLASGANFPVGSTVNTFQLNDNGNVSEYSFTVTVTPGLDTDADGVPNGCDLDDDNDGILDINECTNTSDFFWTDPPTLVNSTTATGTINGIDYTYTASPSTSTTSYLFGATKFPSSLGIPDQTSIRNDFASQNTLTFDEPMTNPVLVFASIGQPSVPVSIQFENDFDVVWIEGSTTTVDAVNNRITGREGNIVIRFNGTFSSLSFDYLNNESWVNFAFGADFAQPCTQDDDGDGIINSLDPDRDNDGCSDAVEGTLGLQPEALNSDGSLSGAVDANGVPLAANGGQGVGTSANASATCVCDLGIDREDPTVSLLGAPLVEVEVNTAYADAGVSAADNCSFTISTDNPVNVAVPGDYTITYTVTDPQNNSSSITRAVRVVDTVDPVVQVQDVTVFLDANGNASVTPSQIDNGSTDNSGGPLDLSLNQTTFDCADLGARNVATIVSDNTWSQSTVVINTPENPYVSVLNQLPDVSTYTLGATVDDPYGTPGFFKPAVPGAQPIRSFGRMKFFRNNFELTGRPQSLRLRARVDNVMEIFINGVSIGFEGDFDTKNFSNTVLHDIFIDDSGVQNGYNGGMMFDQVTSASILDLLQAGDNEIVFAIGNSNNSTDDGGFMVRMDAVADGVPVELTVTDPSGNNSTGQAFVIVKDEIAPQITAPADININATTAAGAVVTFADLVGTDNCSVTTSQTAGLPSGATFPIGTTTVTYTATDASGNTASASFNVNVTGLPPQIVVPADITVSNDFGICGAVVNFTATESVGIPASTITYDIQPGSTFGVGTTVVTATATNAVGSSSASFSVTVNDTQAPTITSPFDITTAADLGLCGAYVTYDIPTATDNCGTIAPPTSLAGYTFKGERNGHTYFLSNAKATPEAAHAAAIAAGGHLATITDAAENTFISNFIADFMWIGATDRDVEGQWKWITNEPYTYTNWAPGEPNNAGAGEDWAVINWGGQSNPSWNDWYYTQPAYYVIEFDGGSLPTTLVSGPASGDFFPVGTTTVTYEAVDPAGNRVTTSFDVTVNDTQAPSIYVPADISTVATSAAGAVVNYSVVSTDNCANESISLISGIPSGGTFPIGTTTVVYSATDAAGNSITDSFNVTVVGVAPEIIVPADITVNNDAGECGASVTYVATDDVGIPASTITYSIAPGSSFDEGTTTVTATATNAVGTDSKSFTVTVVDNELPVVLTQDLTVELDENGQAEISVGGGGSAAAPTTVFWAASNSGQIWSSDIDGSGTPGVVYQGAGTGNAAAVEFDGASERLFWTNGNIWEIWEGSTDGSTSQVQLTNGSGNIAGGNDDRLGISLDLPNNRYFFSVAFGGGLWYANADNTGSPTRFLNISGWISAIDYDAANDWVYYNQYYGTGSPDGIWRVRPDGTGNMLVHASSDPRGMVVDAANNKVYWIERGANRAIMVGNADGTGSPSVLYNYTLSNARDIDLDPSTGNLYWTEFSSSGTGSTDNIVRGNVDGSASSVLYSGNFGSIKGISIGSGLSGGAGVDNGSFDNCGIASMSLDITDFDCSDVGDNTVTLTVTDIHGNVNTGTATITVQDNITPTMATQNITVQLDASGNASITTADIDNGTFDNCDFTLALDVTAFSCADVGANTVTLTATDEHGNVSSATATVTVEDNVAPAAITQDITVQLDASGNASITPQQIDNGSNDACGIASVVVSQTAFDCSNVGVNTVVLTVTDVNGNISTGTATVTVNDVTAPEVTVLDLNVDLDATGNASLAIADFFDQGGIPAAFDKDYEEVGAESADVEGEEDVEEYDVPGIGSANSAFFDWIASATDACGIASITASQLDFDCSHVGDNVITITVTDVNGNVTTAQSTVTINDVTAPIAIAQALTVQLDASGNGSITAAQLDNGSNDACGIASLVASQTAFDCSHVGANTVTLTVTDVNGNQSTSTATVTVEDNVAPIALTQDVTIELDANGAASITTADIDNGSNDACGIASLALDVTDFGCSDVGANTVTLTVTDNNGNVSTATAVVTVQDNIAPTVITQNIEVFLDANGETSITPANVDNGTFDNCAFTLALDNMSFDCSNVGANTVTLTATDEHGNASSAEAIVTVTDAILPTVVPQDINVYLDNEGNTSIVVSDVDGGTFDNCGVASITIDVDSFDCSNLGPNNVTLTATDVNGNVNTGVAVVTVIDDIAPDLGANDITVSLDENGVASIVPEEVLIFGEDDVERDTECDLAQAGDKYVIKIDDKDKPEVSDQGMHSRWWNWGKGKKGDDDDDDKGKDDDDDDKGKDDDDDDGKGKKKYSQYDFAGGTLLRRLDGTLQITGSLVDREDATDSYDVTIELTGAYDYASWRAMEGKVKENKYRNDHLDWSFYRLASGTLTGTGINAGQVIDLSEYNDEEGFQVGTRANGETAGEGIRGKFRTSIGAKGELRLDVTGCELLPVPAGTVYTTDNCEIVDFSFDQDTFSCADYPNVTVNLTATDQSGNTTTVPVTVTVLDEIAPTAIAMDYIEVSVGADGTVVVDPSQIDNGSFDNGDCITLSLDRDMFDCHDVGRGSYFYVYEDMDNSMSARTLMTNLNADDRARHHRGKGKKGDDDDDDDDDDDNRKGKKPKKRKLKGHKVTLTVTDAAGNTDQVESYVVVTDQIAPEVSADPVTLAVYSYTKGRGRKARTYKPSEYLRSYDVEANVTDNCDDDPYVRIPKVRFNVDDAGVNFVPVTATDYYGNVGTGDVTVNVVDITADLDYKGRAYICYKGRTYRVYARYVNHYLRKGATLGSCSNNNMEVGDDVEEEILEEETLETTPDLTVYANPNPASEKATITFYSSVSGPAAVAVYDMQGVEVARVFEGDLEAQRQVRVEFRVDDLPSGLLVIRFRSAGMMKTTKLIVEH